jgi:hypothetical protein
VTATAVNFAIDAIARELTSRGPQAAGPSNTAGPRTQEDRPPLDGRVLDSAFTPILKTELLAAADGSCGASSLDLSVGSSKGCQMARLLVLLSEVRTCRAVDAAHKH